MRYLWSLILAGGMVVGHAGSAQAQFSLSIGNPYTGSGLTVGNPYGYGYGGYGYGYNSYSSYGVGPGVYGYNTGYYGAPVIAAPVVPGYGYPYGVRSYGYSSGYRGFNPGYYGPRYGPTPGFRQGWLYRGFRP